MGEQADEVCAATGMVRNGYRERALDTHNETMINEQENEMNTKANNMGFSINPTTTLWRASLHLYV